MSRDLVHDLSSLTTIPESDIKHIISTSLDVISHDVYEDILCKNELSKIDIGIGDLVISLNEDEVLFKFYPSKDLENIVINTVNNKKDFLVINLENKLYNKIIKAYKELL